MTSHTETVQQIHRLFAEEQENPPVPRTRNDVPVTYEAMTPEWLTAVLAPTNVNARVENYLLGPKDNGTSNRRRVFLEWEGPDAESQPKSVFCKAAHALKNRITLYNGSTKSEVTFYSEIRPTLDIEAPEAIYAAYNPLSWTSVIILKDMPKSIKFCTYETTLSKEQFEGQLRLLAKVHGKFYQSTEEVVLKIGTFKDRFDSLIETLDFESAAVTGFRASRGVMPSAVFAHEPEVWPLTLKAVERIASLPHTLIHGDVHLGNWYINGDEQMGLTDWAVMSRGHWSRDLAYVLGTGVCVENRRQWEHDVVRTYLTELARNGGPSVSEEEAWLEIRKASFLALAYWTVTLTPSAKMPDMQPGVASYEFIRRICVLMDDHDAFNAFKDA